MQDGHSRRVQQPGQVTIAELEAFEEDTRQLHYLLTDLNTHRGPYWDSPTLEEMKRDEAEKERLRLLRQSGRLRNIVDRALGNVSVVYPPGSSSKRYMGTIWELALGNLVPALESEALGQLANRVRSAIGLIEGDPSLLDPPALRQAPPPPPHLPNITIQGDRNVFTYSGRDSTVKHIQTGVDRAELRRVLGELSDAIRTLDRSVTEKAVALTIAEQIMATIDAPDRDVEKTKGWWDYLGRFADGLAVAGAVGAPTTVKALYDQAEPLIRPLLQLGGAS